MVFAQILDNCGIIRHRVVRIQYEPHKGHWSP